MEAIAELNNALEQLQKEFRALKEQRFLRSSSGDEDLAQKRIHGLEKLKMDKDDFSLITYRAYVNAWESKLLGGGRRVPLLQRKLTQIFVDGIRPKQLRCLVQLQEPKTFEEAKNCLKTHLDDLILGQE
jgi:hypothetical protein